MSAIFFAQWFCPCGQCYHQKVFKTITWLPLTRLQSNKPHRNSPERSTLPPVPTPAHTGTLRNLPPEPTVAHTRTIRNLPSGTYNSTHRNSPEPSGTCLRNLHQHTPELSGTCLRNLHHHTPELSGTFRNLPPEPTPAHTGTLRNHQHTPELSGTCLRNLHQHTPELSGTFRNLPPEPAPATRTGTHRSLSGLKTPLAYAVGEKNGGSQEMVVMKLLDLNNGTVFYFIRIGEKTILPSLQVRLKGRALHGNEKKGVKPAVRAKVTAQPSQAFLMVVWTECLWYYPFSNVFRYISKSSLLTWWSTMVKLQFVSLESDAPWKRLRTGREREIGQITWGQI